MVFEHVIEVVNCLMQVNAAGDLCAICQEKMHTPILLRCKHIFCEDCVSEWLAYFPSIWISFCTVAHHEKLFLYLLLVAIYLFHKIASRLHDDVVLKKQSKSSQDQID